MAHDGSGTTFSTLFGLFRNQLRTGRFLMMMTATALAAAVVVGTIKPPAVAAAPLSSLPAAADLTWAPGDVSWEILADGRCLTTQVVQLSTKTAAEATQIFQVMKTLGHKTDFPAESQIQDAHANMVDPSGGTNFGATLHAYLPGSACQAATAQAAALHLQGDKIDTLQLAAAATPPWLKGAIGALVGGVVFVGVSILVAAGITATGVLVGASAVTVAAVTIGAGCIGGAASTAVELLLAGAGGGWKENLSNAIAGCFVGGLISILPIAAGGAAVGNAIRGVFGKAPIGAIVGDGAVVAATRASVEVGVDVPAVVNATAEIALAVR